MTGKPRIRLERWPTPCADCGGRWVYIAGWPDEDSEVMFGCVRALQLVDVVRSLVSP